MNKDPNFWNRRAYISSDMTTWMAIHGNLCLALRHPGNRGPSRIRVISFTKQLGQFLVESGAITEQELKAAQNLEAEEGSKEFEVKP